MLEKVGTLGWHVGVELQCRNKEGNCGASSQCFDGTPNVSAVSLRSASVLWLAFLACTMETPGLAWGISELVCLKNFPQSQARGKR